MWESPVHYDRTRVRELFRLDWLGAQENVIFCGPVGVGKSWFAEALGYSACRAGHRVRFIKVAKLLLALRQARADHTYERELRTWLAPDLLILDDFGLRKLTDPGVRRFLRCPGGTGSARRHGHHEQSRRR